MPKFKSLKSIAVATGVALAGGSIMMTAPVSANHHGNGHSEMAHSNIVETAMSTGVHNTLVAAVKAAGLVDALSAPGPITVFAPIDDAFGKLPDGTVDMLLKPENQGTLQKILTYHAVAGNVSAADLVGMIESSGGAITVDTLAGEQLVVSKFGNTLAITDATGSTTVVAQADVVTSNGTIHVTDGVFLPG